ncbi:hypothetical protein [Ancylobacter rudongensis]|uniref:Uncharacterized protein n=1 Tax=Ancylobacter rudongensis TaxID=177413 RepID=A0A1G4UPN4_9HYPH|nr:hypothetical protein [Ancylobacter rudongensis]SCW95527.1 hypothetical protein SAMN05660859_0048 [Ancylobacter rudongensis]
MNAYIAALEARIVVAKEKNASATNIKKLENMIKRFTNDKFVKLMTSAKVDAQRFARAMYASEKVVKFAHQAIVRDASDLNENTYAIFRTAMLHAQSSLELTKSDCEASLSKSRKIADDKSALVYQRNVTQDESTIAAQVQTSIDALKTLNILVDVADKRATYRVNVNKLAKALCEAFDIQSEKVDA